jgi:mannosyltransferase OCH1-like enzyme
MIKHKDNKKNKYIISYSKKYNNILAYNSYMRLNIPFQLKQSYNSIIPLNLYTCWHTKNLPPLMKANYDYLVESNPKISFHLYDEDDCRKFIKEHFEVEVLNAYNSLIPCSFKSDLWRFCILYIHGGIYMDIKYRCVNNFKFIALTEKEHFVRDIQDNCIYTALIASLPKNELMRKCIYQIVENVKNKYYGISPLYPTGPGLLGKYFTNEERNNLEMYHGTSSIENRPNEYYIVKNDRIILKIYDDYRIEQKIYQTQQNYTILWEEKNIYDHFMEIKNSDNIKNNVQIVVARYHEDLSWMREYPFNIFKYIVYNKGENDNFDKTHVKEIIQLDNVGKCDHTYLYHIIQNYNNLSNIVVFFTGSLNVDYRKQKAIKLLNHIINDNCDNAYFIGKYEKNLKRCFVDFTLEKHVLADPCNRYPNSDVLDKCKIRPYGKWYTYFFGNTPAHWYTFGGIFSIDKRDILQHDISRYELLIQTINKHPNPEAGHFMERSWGIIFYPMIHTKKIQE